MAPRNASARCRKPQRPKRALTAYNLFLRKFMRTQCIASMEDAQRALIAGAKIWSNMSCADRRKYGKQSAKMRVEHDLAMIDYRQQVEALKSPPRPFAAFLRDYYLGGEFDRRPEEKSRDMISRLSKSASCAWKILRPERRLEYTRNFQMEYRAHKLRLSDKEANNNNIDNILLPASANLASAQPSRNYSCNNNNLNMSSPKTAPPSALKLGRSLEKPMNVDGDCNASPKKSVRFSGEK